MWKRIFNPGFNASYLMTLTSGIVEETVKLSDMLKKFGGTQEIFRIKDWKDYLAFDVIGRVVLSNTP